MASNLLAMASNLYSDGLQPTSDGHFWSFGLQTSHCLSGGGQLSNEEPKLSRVVPQSHTKPRLRATMVGNLPGWEVWVGW